MKRPAVVVVLPLSGPAVALFLADSAEDEARVREAIIRRADLVSEVAAALGGLLEALDESAGEGVKAGVPLFSPHDLRHRRISLLHLRGVPWARIGEQVGQRNLKNDGGDLYACHGRRKGAGLRGPPGAGVTVSCPHRCPHGGG